MKKITGLIFICFLSICSTVSAIDGAREINAACVSFGCFEGDSPGFPVTLTQAGKYVLTSNLSQSGSLDVIDITAFDVSLDLNGFLIDGPVTCTGTPVINCNNTGDGYGIRVESANNVRIFNGHLRQLRDTCIFVAIDSRNVWIEGVTLSECGGAGIVAVFGRIEGVVIDRTLGVGINSLFGTTLVIDSYISGAGSFGQAGGTCARNVYFDNESTTLSCVELAPNACNGAICGS